MSRIGHHLFARSHSLWPAVVALANVCLH